MHIRRDVPFLFGIPGYNVNMKDTSINPSECAPCMAAQKAARDSMPSLKSRDARIGPTAPRLWVASQTTESMTVNGVYIRPNAVRRLSDIQHNVTSSEFHRVPVITHGLSKQLSDRLVTKLQRRTRRSVFLGFAFKVWPVPTSENSRFNRIQHSSNIGLEFVWSPVRMEPAAMTVTFGKRPCAIASVSTKGTPTANDALSAARPVNGRNLRQT